MPKLVEGYLETLALAVEMGRMSNSIASQNMRDLARAMARSEAVAPDVVPRWVEVSPTVEQSTGRIITETG